MLLVSRPLLLSFLLLLKPACYLRSPSTRPMSTTTPPPPPPPPPVDASFLQTTLCSILDAPHISFPRPPAGLARIGFGHGPIDLFSTRFANTVADDARGTVAGTDVDKEGLKAALLALQRHWQSDTVEAQDQHPPAVDTSTGEQRLSTALSWTPREATHTAVIKASATIVQEGGAPRLQTLTLDGDPALFQAPH